jgi:hypothetical protein
LGIPSDCPAEPVFLDRRPNLSILMRMIGLLVWVRFATSYKDSEVPLSSAKASGHDVLFQVPVISLTAFFCILY